MYKLYIFVLYLVLCCFSLCELLALYDSVVEAAAACQNVLSKEGQSEKV